MFSSKRAHECVKKLLSATRKYISETKLDLNRLPNWVVFANVQIAHINNSTIFFIEDSTSEKDTFKYCGEFLSDLQFLLDQPKIRPTRASLITTSNREGKLIIFEGEYEGGISLILSFESEEPIALFTVGYVDYHNPIALVNLTLQLKNKGSVKAIRFVPFAMYIHDEDLQDIKLLWEKCTPHIQKFLTNTTLSAAGDYYSKNRAQKQSLLLLKENSVLVYGGYRRDLIGELHMVRDYLRTSYDSKLLSELPDYPGASIEEKVKLWSLVSKFSVMVDRQPTGHLVEYGYLKEMRAILAILRPVEGGSTWMVEADSTELPFIKTFSFKDSPLEVIEEAVSWAENYHKKKYRSK